MSKTYDLEYRSDSLFTAFFPNTQAGETAWRVIAEQTDGTGKVFNMQAAATIAQLRAAGYSVRKAPRPKPLSQSDWESLDELKG